MYYIKCKQPIKKLIKISTSHFKKSNTYFNILKIFIHDLYSKKSLKKYGAYYLLALSRLWRKNGISSN